MFSSTSLSNKQVHLSPQGTVSSIIFYAEIPQSQQSSSTWWGDLPAPSTQLVSLSMPIVVDPFNVGGRIGQRGSKAAQGV
jgi:hypothetical protein